MTPFLQFRLWLRRGPRGERVTAGAAVVLLVALVAWAAVPVDDEEPVANMEAGAESAVDGRVTDGTRAGSDVVPAADSDRADGEGAGTTASAEPVEVSDAEASSGQGAGEDAATGPSGASGGEQPGGAGKSAGRCADLEATDQGVSSTEVFVAVTLINLAGDVGNETFGIRSDLEEVAHAAAAGVNAEGGVACRDMRIKTYRVNPLNENEQRSKCLEIVEDEPFAVIDFAAYLDPVARSCFPEHGLPYQGATSINEEEAARSYPYMYSMWASTDRQLRNWVFEAAERGWFEADDFEKLGLLLNACNPKVNEKLKGNLDRVGVGEDQRSTFTLSCTSVAPPNQISQAVLQHRQDGASHVLFAAPISNAQSYVRDADRQGWQPGYMASDFGSITTGASEDDWSDGFDGARAVTSTRSGELNSGIVHPLVPRCREWYEREGVRPPEGGDDVAYAFCSMFRLFAGAGNAVEPNDLVRPNLVDRGLAGIGRFSFSTQSDAVYDPPGKVTAGDFIRTIEWQLDCGCWKVLEREMTPGH